MQLSVSHKCHPRPSRTLSVFRHKGHESRRPDDVHRLLCSDYWVGIMMSLSFAVLRPAVELLGDEMREGI